MQRARNRDRAFFQCLPQDFERAAVELGQIVQERHAVMSHTDFTGRRRAAATDQTGFANRVMG